MKTVLVLEGGAMRGMYTAGVLDTFLENGLEFDAIIGVSAGALFGVNYLSKQKGRVIRYNKKYNSDKNYLGIKPLLKTGNIVDTEFAYNKVPRELDPFDNDEFVKSNIPFYAVITNIETGEAEYRKIENVFNQMDELRASGSMPFVSKPVEIDGNLYLDGAIADSIPFQYMLDNGYDKIVVVLTRDENYVMKESSNRMIKLFYSKKHPKFAYKLKNRFKMYNNQREKLKELQENGIAEIILPSEEIKINRIEKDENKLDYVYQLGTKDAKKYLENKEKSYLVN